VKSFYIPLAFQVLHLRKKIKRYWAMSSQKSLEKEAEKIYANIYEI